MPLTLEQAKSLTYRQELYSLTEAYGRKVAGQKIPKHCRVNGKPKVWKTRPDEVRVPMVYGLRDCFYITQRDLDEFTLDYGEAMDALNPDAKEEMLKSMEGR